MQQMFTQMNANTAKNNANLANKLNAKLYVMEQRMINLDRRLTNIERSNERSIKRKDSMEKPGQGTDSITLPVSVFPLVFALAPRQFPQFTADNKWRPKKINYFNGSNAKMTAFVVRFRDIVVIKKPKIIQQNLIITFTDETFGWYQDKLTFHKKLVYSFAPNIEPLCETLFARFQPNRFSLFAKLKKSIVKYVQNVLFITNQ